MKSLSPICIGILFAGLAGMLLILLRVIQGGLRDRLSTRECLAAREQVLRNLYDTLLQSTQGFILTVQAAASRMPADDPVRRTLDEALISADALMTDNRDRIENLRPAPQCRRD